MGRVSAGRQGKRFNDRCGDTLTKGRDRVTTQAAPGWYEPVIPTVRAVVFTDDVSSRVLAWLARLSHATELTTEPTS